MKSQVFLNDLRFNEGPENVKYDEDNAQHFLRYQGYR
jgi:hypothetical protein